MTPTEPDPDPSTPDPTATDDRVDCREAGVDADPPHSTAPTELRRLRSLLG